MKGGIVKNVFCRLAIGLLVPETNIVMEPEFCEMVPEGVNIYTARIAIKERNLNGSFYHNLEKTADGVPEAAARISHANIDITVFGCTSGSFLKGDEWNKEIEKGIGKITKTPVVTSTSAVKNALEALRMRKIAVATPYPNDINELLKYYLSNEGFDVVKLESIPYEDSKSEWAAYRLAKQLDRADIDGILISCTDFRTVNILELLERDIGKPVISSNQATLWVCLRLAKIKDAVAGFGSLFREL